MRPVVVDSIALMFLGAIQARAAMTHIFGDRPLTEAQRLEHATAIVDTLWRGLQPEPASVGEN